LASLRFRTIGLCEEVFNHMEELFAVLLPHDHVRAFAILQAAFLRGIHHKRQSAVLAMVQARQAAYAPNRQRGQWPGNGHPQFGSADAAIEGLGTARRTLPQSGDRNEVGRTASPAC